MTISASKVERLSDFLRPLVFEVPEYQRGYEWLPENIDQFHNTIMECVEKKSSQFVGTFILMKTDIGDGPGDQKVHIVDGQQRITTVFMYISVLRDRFQSLSDVKLATSGTKKRPHDPVGECWDILLDSSNESYRLKSNILIRDLLETYVMAADPDPSSSTPRPPLPKKHKPYTKKFRAAIKRINDLLSRDVPADEPKDEQLKKYIEIYEALTKSLTVLSITTSNQVEAMQIFTTINTTGLSLSPSDIVKGRLFSEIVADSPEDARSSVLDELQDYWQTILDNLGKNVDAALRHYLLSRYVSKLQLSQIDVEVGKFLSTGRSDRPERAKQLLGKFVEMSGVYKDILEPNVRHSSKDYQYVYEVIQCLNTINSSARILILAILYREDPAPEVNTADIKKIIQHIEAVVYRWILSGSNAQQLEDKFANIAVQFSRGELTVSKVCDLLSVQLQPSDKVEPTLRLPMADARQSRAILYRIHQYLGDVPRFLLFDSSVLEVEHIAPKTPTEDWQKIIGRKTSPEGADDPESYEYVAEMLGNKTLLEQHINNQIKQKSFTDKSKGVEIVSKGAPYTYSGYAGSKVDMTKDLSISHESWTQQDVELRNEWIISCFLKIFNIPQNLKDLESYSSFVERIKGSSSSSTD